MSVDTYPVELISHTGEIINGFWTYDDEIDDCCLSLHYGENKLTITAIDYFEAMCRIREELEKQKIRPLCYGASKNVFPSGMCRGMGDATLAYKHTLGIRGRRADLVSIFSTGRDVEPATVAEQKAFHEEWWRSL